MTTLQTTSRPSSTPCLPRFATKRTPSRRSLGPEVAAAARSFGQTLTPWQAQVADVALELLPSGIPAYREIIITVPRQNGKTTLVLAIEVQRAVGWLDVPAPNGGPQQIAYTAQDGQAARQKLLVDQVPLLVRRSSPIRHGIERVYKGAGKEAVIFRTGSRLFTLNSGEDAGHGKTIDLGVIDESFADADDRREQAMLPAMLTRPYAQILNLSTAGTERSPFLRRKVDTGRAMVAAGETQGMAYFEWSADPDADIDDPATWWGCMPALGYTQSEEAIRHARRTMPEGEFRRALLNQWTVAEDRVIPAALWNQVCSAEVSPESGLVLALDINPERSAAAVAVSDSQGRCELLEHREGVGWVIERVGELARRWDCPVALDARGPAGSFAGELASVDVRVVSYSTTELAYGCGQLFDAVADQKIAIRRHTSLDEAAAGARRRTIGDSWIWGRRDTKADVCPLVALTMAYDKAIADGRTNDVWFALG